MNWQGARTSSSHALSSPSPRAARRDKCPRKTTSAKSTLVINKRWDRLLKQGNTGTGCLLSLLVLKEEPGRKSTYYNLSISIWEYILDSSYGTAQS